MRTWIVHSDVNLFNRMVNLKCLDPYPILPHFANMFTSLLLNIQVRLGLNTQTETWNTYFIRLSIFSKTYSKISNIVFYNFLLKGSFNLNILRAIYTKIEKKTHITLTSEVWFSLYLEELVFKRQNS